MEKNLAIIRRNLAINRKESCYPNKIPSTNNEMNEMPINLGDI